MRNLLLISALIFTGALFPTHAEDAAGDIETVNLNNGLYMLISPQGGNIMASIGEDGTFIIDDNLDGRASVIEEALKTEGSQGIKFVINTHYHFDHTGTNEHFGGSGAIIVAHENVRKRLSEEQFITLFNKTMPPLAKEGLPIVTMSQDMSLHFNGNTVDLIYVPHAHTDGDLIAFFKENNVIVTGDTVFNGMFPFIDIEHGGSLIGTITAQETVLDLADDATVIIPGHGVKMGKTDLIAYQDTLKEALQRVVTAIEAGTSREDFIASKPMDNLPIIQGPVSADAFAGLIYDDIAKQ